jgi:hypothetical protein
MIDRVIVIIMNEQKSFCSFLRRAHEQNIRPIRLNGFQSRHLLPPLRDANSNRHRQLDVVTPEHKRFPELRVITFPYKNASFTTQG